MPHDAPTSPMIVPTPRTRRRPLAWLTCLLLLVAGSPIDAGTMTKDHKGFLGFPWGSTLSGKAGLEIRESTDRLQFFEPKERPLRIGGIPVESVRLVMIDGQFARVIIRYRGDQTHRQMLGYLESEFGPIERGPGTTTRGLDQQYNWRGTVTEVNLTYGEFKQQGYVFIESRLLAPRFNEGILDGSF